MKLKTRITKCYFVQVIDEEGNQLDCDYVFSDKSYAEYVAKQMKKEIVENEKDRDAKDN